MQTRSYDDLFDLIEALCGVTFASNETAKIRALVNRRAKRAFRSSNYWPRFLVKGEERTVTDNLVPYEEDELDSIDTFLRIHVTEPWVSGSAQEYEYTVGSQGATLVPGGSDPTSAFVTYKSRLSVTYGTEATDSTDVPEEWAEYIAHGTYADFLRMEGQQEKAALADQESNELLQDELARIDEQHGSGILSTRIWTHSNTQTR